MKRVLLNKNEFIIRMSNLQPMEICSFPTSLTTKSVVNAEMRRFLEVIEELTKMISSIYTKKIHNYL
jgi:hypothetical protein